MSYLFSRKKAVSASVLNPLKNTEFAPPFKSPYFRMGLVAVSFYYYFFY